MLKWLLQTLPGICFTIADLAELNDLNCFKKYT